MCVCVCVYVYTCIILYKNKKKKIHSFGLFINLFQVKTFIIMYDESFFFIICVFLYCFRREWDLKKKNIFIFKI